MVYTVGRTCLCVYLSELGVVCVLVCVFLCMYVFGSDICVCLCMSVLGSDWLVCVCFYMSVSGLACVYFCLFVCAGNVMFVSSYVYICINVAVYVLCVGTSMCVCGYVCLCRGLACVCVVLCKFVSRERERYELSPLERESEKGGGEKLFGNGA